MAILSVFKCCQRKIGSATSKRATWLMLLTKKIPLRQSVRLIRSREKKRGKRTSLLQKRRLHSCRRLTLRKREESLPR